MIFTITEDHLKLLQRAYVRWEDCETGAPAIDCKRPYGNSYVEGDVAEILGWEVGEELTYAQQEKAFDLHQQTMTALQICLSVQKFEAGTYVQPDKYDYQKWVKHD